MKICARCKVEKESEQFPKHHKTRDGLDSWCKECKREYKMARDDMKYPERVRRRRLRENLEPAAQLKAELRAMEPENSVKERTEQCYYCNKLIVVNGNNPTYRCTIELQSNGIPISRKACYECWYQWSIVEGGRMKRVE